ncbi:alkaline phosphatase family protein [Aquimarina algiphila]|nr:alkaline phosphatase family protein [Aquimarina algiphila]
MKQIAPKCNSIPISFDCTHKSLLSYTLFDYFEVYSELEYMMYKLIIIIFLFFSYIGVRQRVENEDKKIKPKLFVGIVVDQMHYDYLTRFYDQFEEGEFKKMIRASFSYKNHLFTYIPTTTESENTFIYRGYSSKPWH